MRRLLVLALTLAIGHLPLAISSSLAKETGEDRPVGSLGGAVHADPFTGVATTSIPIEVPPGRNGMQPSLALTYNSAAGNGWLGMGWDLEQEGIYRQTKWGVDYSKNTDMVGGKAFVVKMAGVSGELVQTPSPAPSTQWSTKIEGGFSKIEKLAANDGQIMWKVTTKQGRKHYFGQSDNSRVRNPTARSQISEWRLDKIEDMDGNYLLLFYTRDQEQLYLDRVEYAYPLIGGQTIPHMVKFYLEDRTDASPMYTTNFLVKTAKRLKTIEVKANSQSTRAYRLCYWGSASPCPAATGTSTSSLLSSVQQYGSDASIDQATGNITGGSSIPTITFTWQSQPSVSFPRAFQQQNYPTDGQIWRAGFPTFLGDFDGDGKIDILQIDANNYLAQTLLSNGNGTFTRTFQQQNYPTDGVIWRAGSDVHSTFTGDLDGDGKADILQIANGTYTAQSLMSNDPPPDRLISVASGLGGATTITYDTSANDANNRVPFAVQRVKTLSTCDHWNSATSSCSTTPATTTYSYSGGYYHIGERDLRGVNYVKVTGQAAANGDQTINETWFHQGSRVDAVAETVTELQADVVASTKGLPFRMKVTDQTGKIYSESTSTYKADADGVAPWFTPPALTTTSIYDSAGALVKQTQTESVT